MESEPEPGSKSNRYLQANQKDALDPLISAYGVVRDEKHILLKKSEEIHDKQKRIVYGAIDTSLITSLGLLKQNAVDEHGRPTVLKWVEQYFNQLFHVNTLTVGKKAALVERYESSDGKLRIFFNVKVLDILALPSLPETEILSKEQVEMLLHPESADQENTVYALEQDTRNALIALNKVLQDERIVLKDETTLRRKFWPLALFSVFFSSVMK